LQKAVPFSLCQPEKNALPDGCMMLYRFGSWRLSEIPFS
jgi:hypothetical protein